MAEAGRTTRAVAETSGAAGSTIAAGNAGGGGKADTGDLKTIATDIAGEIAGTAAEQGRSLLNAAKGSATSFADERKGNAAQSIADIASSLRETGEGFGEQPSLKAFVGTAADGLDQLATGLRDRSYGDIYADLETLARRQPVTFGIGAAVAGFLLARFIKSSSEDLSDANAARAQTQARQARARQGGTPSSARVV